MGVAKNQDWKKLIDDQRGLAAAAHPAAPVGVQPLSVASRTGGGAILGDLLELVTQERLQRPHLLSISASCPFCTA